MSKPTMGRGLGDLLSETKPQGDNQNQNGKTQIAPGVRTLMQGVGNASAAKVAPAVAEAPTSKPKPFVAPKGLSPINNPKGPAIPRWIFLAADFLLIALALFITLKSPKPMPTSRMIVAIVVVILAAGCGLCALLAGPEKD